MPEQGQTHQEPPRMKGPSQEQTPEPLKTFQTKATEAAVVKLREMLAEIPELRSLIIVFDWQDNLSEFSPCGTWVTRGGEANANMINEIPAGMVQLMRMYQTQQQLALQHINRLRQITQHHQQLALQAQESLDATKQELDAAAQNAPVELVSGESRPDGNIGGSSPPAEN